LAGLFVVRPRPDDLDGFLFFENLIDKAVLDVDPPRAGPDKVPSKLLVGRQRLEGIPLKDFQRSNSGNKTGVSSGFAGAPSNRVIYLP